jgi:hypothetical protein
MKLDLKMHIQLEQFCKHVCTGKIGWNRKKRKECRNNSMCKECHNVMSSNASAQGCEAYPAASGSASEREKT